MFSEIPVASANGSGAMLPGASSRPPRAGRMTAVPSWMVRTVPMRSAMRPPSSVPATPPARKQVSATPARPREAFRCRIQYSSRNVFSPKNAAERSISMHVRAAKGRHSVAALALGRGGLAGLPAVLAQQDEGHQDGGRQEQHGRFDAQRDQRRSRQRGSEEEADAPARREQAHRARAIARVLPGALARGRMEHRHPQPGQQDHAPRRGIGREQPGQAQPEPGEPDPRAGHPARPQPVRHHAEERLRQ